MYFGLITPIYLSLIYFKIKFMANNHHQDGCSLKLTGFYEYHQRWKWSNENKSTHLTKTSSLGITELPWQSDFFDTKQISVVSLIDTSTLRSTPRVKQNHSTFGPRDKWNSSNLGAILNRRSVQIWVPAKAQPRAVYSMENHCLQNFPYHYPLQLQWGQS